MRFSRTFALVGRHENVARFEITVDNQVLMGVPNGGRTHRQRAADGSSDPAVEQPGEA